MFFFEEDYLEGDSFSVTIACTGSQGVAQTKIGCVDPLSHDGRATG